MALEFQLASDILSTSISPGWRELGELSATAVIPTGLNLFLAREIREFVGMPRREEPQTTRQIYIKESGTYEEV
jgi:hypothetical protein